MTLFLHVDRAGNFKSGDIIEPIRNTTRKQGVLDYSLMFCQDFIEHLRALMTEGVSYHGMSYLSSRFESGNTFRIDLIMQELHLEYSRMKAGVDEPSRLQSLFAWRNFDDALRFAKDNKAYPTIYEVEALGRFFEGDMNLSRRTGYENAVKYWRGEPLSNDAEYSPLWECLLELPVRVLRKVEIKSEIKDERRR